MSPVLPFTLRRSPTGALLIVLAGIIVMALALAGAYLTPDINLRGLLASLAVALFFLDAIWLIWYWSGYMQLTTKGVTSVNYTGLVSPTDAITEWARVQDVTYKESGLFQSLFNVGTLSFQTAGTDRYFKLSWVGDVSKWASYFEQQAEAAS